jgi:hypothetical protein
MRWTARILGTLCILFVVPFILAEGLPAIGSQPGGVQLTFFGGFLLLLGFIVGWWREGTAAGLITAGWTVIRISESDFQIATPFELTLVVAALYAGYWWAAHGRRTAVMAGAAGGFAVLLLLGRLLCPASVFVRGVVTDTVTGKPVAEARLVLARKDSPDNNAGERPDARTDKEGRFELYVGWYAEGMPLAVSAPGYATLTTNLGPRPVGARRLNRDLRMQAAAGGPAANDLRQVLHDNEGLDLDTGTVRAVRRVPDTNILATLDIGWDNDGGGALMVNPSGAARILALPDVQNFGEAVVQAKSRENLVRTSEERGSFASRCRFFAVVTDRGGLAAVEVTDPSETQATIYWRLLAAVNVANGPPPVIVRTEPESGAADVDASLTELRATFSKPMQGGRHGWVGLGANAPGVTGPPRYSEDGRTSVLPVKLQPGRIYAIWLNSESARDFADRAGQPAVPYLLIFETRK